MLVTLSWQQFDESMLLISTLCWGSAECTGKGASNSNCYQHTVTSAAFAKRYYLLHSSQWQIERSKFLRSGKQMGEEETTEATWSIWESSGQEKDKRKKKKVPVKEKERARALVFLLTVRLDTVCDSTCSRGWRGHPCSPSRRYLTAAVSVAPHRKTAGRATPPASLPRGCK